MLSDIEIAQRAKPLPISEIARRAGLEEDEWEEWGRYRAKVSLKVLDRLKGEKKGKLILVTTINPTPAGEGKTTTTIGLAQALYKLGYRAMMGIREPSLGPVFGIKGGAAGGGYSQVIPMEDINLHFTGDMHAITSAHNLLAAMLNNHMHHGNELEIDPRRIYWHRVMDMNDRALRNIVIGLGGPVHGVPQEDHFDITPASEIMAILCLATSFQDLKERLSRIVVAQNKRGEYVTASDLKAVGAMALLLKDAIRPNLVQSLEGVPAFVHGGPFANIAHGTSTIISTKMGLGLSDYFVTEAGFGSDLGAEKFFNIVSRIGGFSPDLVVMVVTARALKFHGGVPKDRLMEKNVEAVKKGCANLSRHLDIVHKFGLPVVVAINLFEGDHPEEIEVIEKRLQDAGVPYARSDVHRKGGEGGIELAKKVVETIDCSTCSFSPLYPLELPIKEKIGIIASQVYGASRVVYSVKAERAIEEYEGRGYKELPICMVKTQYSLSDDPKKLGAPKSFKINIQEVRLAAGAGFILPYTGTITTMPGLPKRPAAENMDIDEEGRIVGLF
ncbi:MAG: formate--tetrahydrofolate ligase [Thermoplasmata archaeon]|nr:formate--tetrahydrofolate ligase [Thermoplasmata archaeon]